VYHGRDEYGEGTGYFVGGSVGEDGADFYNFGFLTGDLGGGVAGCFKVDYEVVGEWVVWGVWLERGLWKVVGWGLGLFGGERSGVCGRN
jgi:hypothetical protein